jgi:serine/threonine protein kinase
MIKRYRSEIENDLDATARSLALFFAASPVSLGAVDFDFLHRQMTLIEPLGRGSTSWVARAVLPNGENRAVKISCNKEALVVERAILNYLNESLPADKVNMVPTVDAITLLDEAIKEHITTFYEVLGRKSEADARHRLISLWELLRQVHNLGIVHCDVRTANLRLNTSSDTLAAHIGV